MCLCGPRASFASDAGPDQSTLVTCGPRHTLSVAASSGTGEPGPVFFWSRPLRRSTCTAPCSDSLIGSYETASYGTRTQSASPRNTFVPQQRIYINKFPTLNSHVHRAPRKFSRSVRISKHNE